MKPIQYIVCKSFSTFIIQMDASPVIVVVKTLLNESTICDDLSLSKMWYSLPNFRSCTVSHLAQLFLHLTYHNIFVLWMLEIVCSKLVCQHQDNGLQCYGYIQYTQHILIPHCWYGWDQNHKSSHAVQQQRRQLWGLYTHQVMFQLQKMLYPHHLSFNIEWNIGHNSSAVWISNT